MFEEIEKYAQENFIPIIRPLSRQLLCEQVKNLNPKKILEIGTAIGFSGLLLLKSSKAFLTTIEKDQHRAEIAKNNFKKYGVEDRVKLICDDAMNVLKSFANNNEKFDFVFLDGPKGQYYRYLPMLAKILNKDGVVFADYVFLHGLVKSNLPIPHKSRSMVNNMRKYLLLLEKSNCFDSKVLDVEDGIAISRKIDEL